MHLRLFMPSHDLTNRNFLKGRLDTPDSFNNYLFFSSSTRNTHTKLWWAFGEPHLQHAMYGGAFSWKGISKSFGKLGKKARKAMAGADRIVGSLKDKTHKGIESIVNQVDKAHGVAANYLGDDVADALRSKARAYYEPHIEKAREFVDNIPQPSDALSVIHTGAEPSVAEQVATQEEEKLEGKGFSQTGFGNGRRRRFKVGSLMGMAKAMKLMKDNHGRQMRQQSQSGAVTLTRPPAAGEVGEPEMNTDDDPMDGSGFTQTGFSGGNKSALSEWLKVMPGPTSWNGISNYATELAAVVAEDIMEASETDLPHIVPELAKIMAELMRHFTRIKGMKKPTESKYAEKLARVQSKFQVGGSKAGRIWKKFKHGAKQVASHALKGIANVAKNVVQHPEMAAPLMLGLGPGKKRRREIQRQARQLSGLTTSMMSGQGGKRRREIARQYRPYRKRQRVY